MSTLYLYPSGQSTLADAKARLNIHDLWRRFGFPGEPKASCRSPFRDDCKPSFSVNSDGTLWNDFATGEAGDAVDFFQRASGLSRAEACRKFIKLAGGHFAPAPRAARPQRQVVEAKLKPVFPDFRQGTVADFKQLASFRNISREGVEWASERGLLWFATLKGCPAWIVTDAVRVSASIGAGLQVTSGPNRVTRGNLYIMASAESGTGKSETFRHAAKPFFDFERELVDRWKAEDLPGLQAEADMLESEIDGLKKKARNCESSVEREEFRAELQAKKKALADVNAGLNPPRLCCEDVTSEKLAVMLASNQEQLSSLSPDAGTIVNILLGRYNKLDRTDEGIYLKTFSGDNCRVDRQGREPVLLLRPCLTALWLTQPDKVEALLAERSLTDGGLIPRLLVCHSHAQPQPIVDGVEGIPAATANAWALLLGKLIKTFRMAGEPVTVDTTPEARQIMDAHYNRIVARRLADLRDVTPYAARWSEQAWRIAVCLHAGLHGEDAGERKLEADTAASAIALADWFAGEQLRILARGRHAARRAKQDEVLELLADNPKGITARDVQRKGIKDSADEARTLLAEMEADGELTGKDSQPGTGGHITRTFTLAQK